MALAARMSLLGVPVEVPVARAFTFLPGHVFHAIACIYGGELDAMSGRFGNTAHRVW